MERIQIIAIIVSLLFTLTVLRLILRGKLREEYSIIWILCTLFLIIFSFWRNGLDYISDLVGIHEPVNFLFIGLIFAILLYLLHLNLVVSKLQEQNKKLAQEMALLQKKN